MKVRNKLFLSLIIGLFLITFVSSAPALKSVQTNTAGYQIFYPEFQSIKQNQGFTLHLHTSNISTGYPVPNSVLSCYLHLYNSTGKHTFESGILGKDSNGWDHEIYIDKGNFSDLYTHAYYIWCNGTAFGGEAKGTFEVTPTGFVGTLGFYFILIILSILLIIIGYSVEDEWLVILGAFGFILLGLFILLYGIDGIMDKSYTYGFAIITMMAGAYFAIRGALNKIGE